MASDPRFSRGRLLLVAWCLPYLFGICCLPAWADELWVCPGNLFTNQIGPREAREQSCVRAEPSRLSQAHGPVVEGVAVATPSVIPAPAEPLMATERSSALQSGEAKPVPVDTQPVVTATVGNRFQTRQQARDNDARAILQAELQRTQAQIRAFEALQGEPPNAAVLHRLRGDEAALLREIARLGR